MAPEVVNGFAMVADKERSSLTRLFHRRFSSSSKVNTKMSTSNTGMEQTGVVQSESSARIETTRPPHLRRRITIGGSGQDAQAAQHTSLPTDTRHGSTTLQGGGSGSLTAKCHYPPTSWRPTPPAQLTVSDVERNDLSGSGSNGGEDDGTRKSSTTVQVAGPHLNPPLSNSTMTASSPEKARDPPASSNGEYRSSPARPGSRRRYSIISSMSTNSTNAGISPTRTTGASTLGRRASGGIATLPDPRTVYAHTYHYTVCAHTSPPMSRPLNVQPKLVRYREGLLAYPPFHLRGYNADQSIAPPTIYILDGSCADCDIKTRRHAESKVLSRYSHQLENLYIQLSLVQKDIANKNHDVSIPEKSDSAVAMFSFPSTLELETEATQAILEIEDQLDQLISSRDREVRQIWNGYTARWGPATVGIHREHKTRERSQARAAVTSDSMSQDTAASSTGFDVPLSDHSPGRSRTMTTLSTKPASHVSRNSSSDTHARTRSVGGPQERYSDGTYGLSVDSSVDGVKGRGRMVVDWIRPSRREGRSRSVAGATSRTSSRNVPDK
ncbi:hypothetical protein AYO21_11554 [Fonsecaea monophora]|uniref:Uncharacterized protein n=1 Tax=Fonsecaea monophora TaxID=254056 RepID=A0A177EQS2_9EURO|nr:hypothetical protein AYO21_11554 [Fonsecaea monophora]OAG34307.1 hypothetical protein AYO21_11554 [Fonsecaea monophora]